MDNNIFCLNLSAIFFWIPTLNDTGIQIWYDLEEKVYVY